MHPNSTPAQGTPSTHWTQQDGAGHSVTGRPLTAVVPAFRLLDDFQAGFIKFQGREPRTLEELAIALADNEHKRRLAEVKAMRKSLAKLDEFLPALAARGIKVWARDIHSHDQGKKLRIYPGMFVGNDDKLHAALIELGFREVKREVTTHGNDTVTLQHGRWLVVTIDVSKKPVAPEGGAA